MSKEVNYQAIFKSYILSQNQISYGIDWRHGTNLRYSSIDKHNKKHKKFIECSHK